MTLRASDVGSVVILGVMLLAFASLLLAQQAVARRALDDRFATRASLTATFAASYLEDLAARERRLAERLLAAPEVDKAAFEEVVVSLDLQAAVLLDEDGRLLHVWPARPEILGNDMTIEYAHLRAAVAGNVAVSNIVPSAAVGEPIVAIATPFRSGAGLRTFSGAFAPDATPLGRYLDTAAPFRGGHGYILDGADRVVAGGSSGTDESGLAGLSTGVSGRLLDGTASKLASSAVSGSPWTVVLTAPAAELYKPLGPLRWVPWLLWTAFAIAGAAAVGSMVRMERLRTKSASEARTDQLTGLPNRRAIEEHLVRAAAHAARRDTEIAVALVDLDNFKAVNDTYGHKAGDAVLQAVASVLTASTRTEDLVARWGGEEFLILMEDSGLDGALVAAERVRSAVAHAPGRAGSPARVTISIGLAVGGPTDVAELVTAADAALYRAKDEGRNRVAWDQGQEVHQ